MPSQATVGNKQGPLTRELIASKALELADCCGIENVTARKLAAELGKTPMSLYRHFNSIEDIHEAVLAMAYREVDSRSIPGERWDDSVRRFANSIRDMYHRHINAKLAIVPTGVDSPALKPYTTTIFNLQISQGIPPEILYKLWRIADAFLTGFLTNELVSLRASKESPPEGESLWQSCGVCPYTEDAFQDGLNIILSGIAAEAAPDPADWHTPDEQVL